VLVLLPGLALLGAALLCHAVAREWGDRPPTCQHGPGDAFRGERRPPAALRRGYSHRYSVRPMTPRTRGTAGTLGALPR
jgi:hypothetical protein